LPLRRLASPRRSPSMSDTTDTTDLAIVGAGILGLAVAREALG
jgi:glycerol-3-phosphate dehydrogenase